MEKDSVNNQRAVKYSRIGRSHENIEFVRARVVDELKCPIIDVYNKLNILKGPNNTGVNAIGLFKI